MSSSEPCRNQAGMWYMNIHVGKNAEFKKYPKTSLIKFEMVEQKFQLALSRCEGK